MPSSRAHWNTLECCGLLNTAHHETNLHRLERLRTKEKRTSRQPSDDLGNALLAGGAAASEDGDGDGDSLRLSIESDFDDAWAVDDPKGPPKKWVLGWLCDGLRHKERGIGGISLDHAL